MDPGPIILLAITAAVLALVLGSLFSHPRTRPLMIALGTILRFLAAFLR